jgi:hypothetical protein
VTDLLYMPASTTKSDIQMLPGRPTAIPTLREDWYIYRPQSSTDTSPDLSTFDCWEPELILAQLLSDNLSDPEAYETENLAISSDIGSTLNHLGLSQARILYDL